MSEVSGSEERVDCKLTASSDTTNGHGKRVLLTQSSEKCNEVKRIRKSIDEPTMSSFEQDVDGTDDLLLKNSDKNPCNSQPSPDDKGKGVLPFDPKQLLRAMNLYSSAWQNLFPSLSMLSGHTSFAAHNVMDSEGAECGGRTDPIAGQSNKSGESATEYEQTSGDDREAESAGSMGYGTADENYQDISAAPNCAKSKIDAAEERSDMLSEDGSYDDPFVKLPLFNSIKAPGTSKKTNNSEGLNAGLNYDETNTCFKESCCCSFCLKAGYMWVDLHYQDIRGRFSALKRSSKLARSFGSRIGSNCTTPKASNEKSNLDLECELSEGWKSLFSYTENVLVRETSQLHSTLLSLKELRTNCKSDLETICKDPSNK